MPESIGIFLAVVFLSFRFRMRAVANQAKSKSRSFAPLTPRTNDLFAGPQAAPFRMTLVPASQQGHTFHWRCFSSEKSRGGFLDAARTHAIRLNGLGLVRRY